MYSFLWPINAAGLKHDHQSLYCYSFPSFSQLWVQEMGSLLTSLSHSRIVEPITDSTFKTSHISHGIRFFATMPVQVTIHSPESNSYISSSWDPLPLVLTIQIFVLLALVGHLFLSSPLLVTRSGSLFYFFNSTWQNLKSSWFFGCLYYTRV